MRLVAAFFAVLLATPLAAADFENYQNQRFYFAIDYPAGLVAQPPPANNDGRVFLSEDGKVKLIAAAHYNALNETLAQLAREAEAVYQGGRITYRRVMADYFVISGFQGDDVFYQATALYRHPEGDGEVVATFIFTYPRETAPRYNPMVKRMLNSFLASLRGVGIRR